MHVTTHAEASGHSCVLEKWPLPSLSASWPQHGTLKRKKAGVRRPGRKRNKSRETAQGSQAGRDCPAALSWHLRPGLGREPSTPQMEMSSCLFLGCLNKQRGLCWTPPSQWGDCNLGDMPGRRRLWDQLQIKPQAPSVHGASLVDTAVRVVGLLAAGGVTFVFYDDFRGQALLQACAWIPSDFTPHASVLCWLCFTSFPGCKSKLRPSIGWLLSPPREPLGLRMVLKASPMHTGVFFFHVTFYLVLQYNQLFWSIL